MKIVAFMQNAWFRPGTNPRAIKRYMIDQDFHKKILRRTMSGKRLVAAFGSYFDHIHWDNVGTEHASMASGLVKVDHIHVLQVVRQHDPTMILTFGRIAERAVRTCEPFFYPVSWVTNSDYHGSPPVILSCHHPNARHRTQADLNDFAVSAIKIYATDPLIP